MIVDHLVLHHTYSGNSAFDVSQNHHHGRLEHVSVGGGSAHFTGGPNCVRVPTSPTLAKMRAVRTSVRFRWEPNGHRRFNLIEGYLSFALVIDGDNSLHGTIHQRGGGWPGAKSAPGTVQPGVWHEAVFVHDGFSACRVELDGTTVAEAFDVPGPVSGVEAPYGIAIGHWPDPGDQYSYVGEMSDVRVWIDRPEAIRDVVDDCCIDGEVIDEAFFDVRAGDFDRAAYDHAAQVMQDLGAKTFGGIASGGPTERAEAWDLARRFALGLTTGDRTGFVESIAKATQLAAQRIPEPTLLADVGTLVDALRPTAIGPLVDAMASGASIAEQEKLLDGLDLSRWIDAFCFGWTRPTDPKGKRPERPKPQPDHSVDPTTDQPDGSPSPAWGTAADHHHDEPAPQPDGGPPP